MITLSRSLARRLRSVLRRSVVEQEPRGEWPLLLCRAGPQGLLLSAQRGEVAVRCHQAGPQPPSVLAFRASLLAGFEGRADEPVSLEAVGPGQARARWQDAGAARELDLEAVDPEGVPPLPPLPKDWSAQPQEFCEALAAAAETAATRSVRYALSRVQLRGRAGQVVATDGRQLLVRGGFPLPWPEDVLVPRLPVLGLRELRDLGPAQVGRTEGHVHVRTGPWIFSLAIDAKGRFPDHQRVVPTRTSAGCRLRVAPEDAALLIRELPRLPGGQDEFAPVTLDLDRPVTVRATDAASGQAGELTLTRSVTDGPAARLCLNGHYLRRALQLGFRELHAGGPDQPLVWRDDGGLYLCVSLDPKAALPAGKAEYGGDQLTPAPPVIPEPRRSQVPMVEQNTNGHGGGAPAPGGLEELIAEAEELRRVLHESAGRAHHLVAALKHQRRQGRAVEAALTALRQLQPAPTQRRPAPLSP